MSDRADRDPSRERCHAVIEVEVAVLSWVGVLTSACQYTR